MLTSDQYTESHGRECPVCGSEQIHRRFSELEHYDDFVEVEAICNRCGSVWSITYALHGMEVLHERYENGAEEYSVD